MAKNIIVKQNKEIFALKNNNEETWKEKHPSSNHELERKLKETIEANEELKHQSAKLRSEIYNLTEQLNSTNSTMVMIGEISESLQ